MKMKLVMAVALATVTAIGSFIDSAAAQRGKGSPYSQSSQCSQTCIAARFILFAKTAEGDPIVDQVSGDDSLGLFTGAIENYTFGRGNLADDQGNIDFDSNGNVIPAVPFEPTAAPFDGDLLAEFIDSDPDFGNRPTIQYSIFETGVTTATVSYKLDFQDPSGFGSFPIVSLPSAFDPNQAVNSLPYILENNLLGATEPLPGEGDYVEIIKTVPEPGFAPGALVALGAGLLLKRSGCSRKLAKSGSTLSK